MRIVAWNILDGGVGRADPIAEVLLAQRADVVMVLEADDEAVVDRLSRRLNMTSLRCEGPGAHAAPGRRVNGLAARCSLDTG